MPLLGSDYDSSADEHHNSEAAQGQSSLVSTSINPAPEVALDVWSHSLGKLDVLLILNRAKHRFSWHLLFVMGHRRPRL